jgi:hypothetical protein
MHFKLIASCYGAPESSTHFAGAGITRDIVNTHVSKLYAVEMLASTNKTNTRFGQVLEYVLSLEQSDLIADLKEQFLVFKSTTTGADVVRIKQTEN